MLKRLGLALLLLSGPLIPLILIYNLFQPDPTVPASRGQARQCVRVDQTKLLERLVVAEERKVIAEEKQAIALKNLALLRSGLDSRFISWER